jgi:hypothetical protein
MVWPVKSFCNLLFGLAWVGYWVQFSAGVVRFYHLYGSVDCRCGMVGRGSGFSDLLLQYDWPVSGSVVGWYDMVWRGSWISG